MKILPLVMICFSISWVSFSQGTQDTVFIKQIKITANYLKQKQNAGVKETKIDSTIFMSTSHESLSQLLHNHTSLFIKNHGRGALASISLRGTTASHTQVKWNGLTINSPMTGMTDFSLIPVYIIDDLSIMHGSASINSTSGALGGCININNKPVWTNRFKFKTTTGFGSYSTTNKFLKLHHGNKKIQTISRVYHNSSKNDYEYLNKKNGTIDSETGSITHHKVKNENGQYTLYGAMQEFYYKTNSNNLFGFKYWGQKSDRSLPNVTSNESTQGSNVNNSIRHDHKLIIDWKLYKENSQLYVTGGFSNEKMRYTYKNYVSGQGMTSTINSLNKYSLFTGSIEYKYTDFSALSIRSKFDFTIADVSSYEEVFQTGYKRQRNTYNSLLSADYTLYERLKFSLLLRHLCNNNNASHFIPYFGFDYKIFKNQELYLKGNIARNYHLPTLNELYWLPGGNIELKAEKGYGQELGVSYLNNNFESELTAYRKNITDWIIWMYTGRGFWTPNNIALVKTKGIEYNANYNNSIKKLNYKILGSYSYTQSLNYGNKKNWGDQSYGKQLIYVPLHNANLTVNLNYKHWNLHYSYCFYSERFTTTSNDVTNRDRLYPYHMNDLNIGKKFQLVKDCDLSAQLKIYNLFNESYRTILGQQMPGRNYMFLLTLNY